MLGGTLRFREQLSARPEPTWIERTPAGYSLPSLLLPSIATLFVFGLNRRWLRHTLHTLTDVGVGPLAAVTGLTLAVMAWCLASAAAGAVVGSAIGIGVRAIIGRLRDRAPGPLEALATPVLQLFAVVVVVGVGAAAALALSSRRVGIRIGRRTKATTATARRRLGRDGRHILAVIGWCAVVAYAMRVHSPPQAMILAGVLTIVVLLITPDMFDLLLRKLPEGGPRRRLARRQLVADRRRATGALAVLTVLLGASLGYLALLDTMVRTAETQAYPDALPGQVLLAGRASITFPPPATLLKAVEASGVVEQLPHASVLYLFTSDSDGSVQSATLENRSGNLLAVETPAQVEYLVGHALTAEQRATLAEGGLLVWADTPEAPSRTAPVRIAVADGDTLLRRTSPLPATAVEIPLVDWRVATESFYCPPPVI